MHFIETDLKHIWHPCEQMKDFQQYPPILVSAAKGCMLDTDKGPIIDAISSWWCKSLGHGHPAVLAAIKDQMDKFEHVITATTTHESLAEFGAKLMEITKLQHVFFASDGSSAVEIAMKMALHAKQLQGKQECNEFIALSNSYHGETLGTLSISDLGIFKKPYAGFGVTCHFIQSLPYVSGIDDPLWNDCDQHWPSFLAQLEAHKNKACAIIVEPLVQGANGMRCYSADFLKKLAVWAKENDIFFIADEIMTGIGRTGQWLACQHANVHPDMICLSKGLTSGTIPMSCVAVDHSIYDLFYDDFDTHKAFLHSHTQSGNALGVSAALATIKTIENELILENVREIGTLMREKMLEIAELTGNIGNVRSLGAIVAADLENPGQKRLGFQLYQEAIKRGALLRPIGNTLYWLPPLNIERENIEKLAGITLNSIRAVYS